MQEEITETTFVETKKRRTSVFWINLLALAVLAGVVFAAREISLRFYEGGSVPPDRQIVLEDLENETPLAESEVVKIPSVGETIPAKRVAVLKTTPLKTLVRKPPLQKKIIPEYALPDPYTSGGPEDLDGPANREEYRGSNVIRIAPQTEASATAPAPEEEPEAFIPFETE